MDRYGLLGHPVAHSKSPWIHARFAQLCGQSLVYEAMLVPLDGFDAAVHAFRDSGGRGCNVTVPFKFQAAALAGDSISPRAALAGACNTLVFQGDGSVLGDNTDGIGLVHDIQDHAGFSLAGKRVLLVGAGGAAAGVLGPLIEAAPTQITIANRTVSRAQDLVDRHAALAERHGVALQARSLADAGTGHQLVINGTASSLSGDAVPVAATVLGEGALAYDMMYGAAAQGFLDWARRHGAAGRDGLGMLVEQAAESFALWRGVRPPSAQVLSELRDLLNAPSA